MSVVDNVDYMSLFKKPHALNVDVPIDSKYEDKSVLKDKNDEFEDSVLIEEKLMKSKTTRFGKNYFCNLKNSAVAQEKIFNNYKIISNSNPKINILIENEFSLANEYWKALSLCHECIINENNEIAGVRQDDIE